MRARVGRHALAEAYDGPYAVVGFRPRRRGHGLAHGVGRLPAERAGRWFEAVERLGPGPWDDVPPPYGDGRRPTATTEAGGRS
ncbi:hypothetical protein HHL19_17135 [Streptomyces sp. R302]|uniref:hypothetical protein n=1 Tax=unclassified Streptomyces TaxID=2593676 RepID=UPI00145F4149|nr:MULTISPECIES: hypothetical protein [unclassified Streptomyces]NML52711.1 hypothetical protein [Streptomyces sp. R301]NML80360.1 hypothetical protein [Streptomyces sp. R302]